MILCSSRQPRVCPQIASYVTAAISPLPNATLTTIDLSTWNLPMFNEPTIPSYVFSPSGYVQTHTRAWSAEISKHSAFIFILPQYNWGYPAVLKNAIDYLFNEWKGKPAVIVSYGGHGGGMAAEQLKQVLGAIGMKVTGTMPALTFPGRKVLVAATKGEDIREAAGEEFWVGEKDVVAKAGEELMVLLAEGVVGSVAEKGKGAH